ncbi:MAG: hypothetical protein KatS3mg047_1469 [Bellilinea sp.]|nr:MAG: hypothetical protein KatS3mg047_1469 [Bellilinea sp.]
MIRIGHIVEIPLSNQRKAYAQYIIRDRMGPIIKVFKHIGMEKPDLDLIVNSGELFPPVITGLFAAVRTGLWTIIGSRRVENLQYPGFVSTFYNQKTGEATIWYYWDGKQSIRLGPVLPDEYKAKEYLMVWSPYDVMHRIETGEYPFPYKDLILYNRFTPRNFNS